MEIIQNEKRNRFETTVEGHSAYVEYSLFDNGIVFSHTEVPSALAGKGIGSALAQFVLEFAEKNDLKIVPVCPFISKYIVRHPQYKPLLK